MMRDTVHCLVEGEPDQAAITASVHAMIKEVQKICTRLQTCKRPCF